MQRDIEATKFKNGQQLVKASDAAFAAGNAKANGDPGAASASGGQATVEKARAEFEIDDAGSKRGGEKR